MVISLYTSRVLLSVLGQDNFGIFNLVAGIVILFSFVTNSMTSSTQRFLNFYSKHEDKEIIIKVFGSARIAHYIVLLIFLILAETIGIWFVETQLNIEPERMVAARWVYQTSIISALFGIIVIPYRAAIIAEERMGIFAYISIIEVILKLIIVFLLYAVAGDKLIIYSILFVAVSAISYYAHKFCCRRFVAYSTKPLVFEKTQLKELLSFSGWYVFGGVAMVGTKQGTNILINIFFNVGLNAAVGIANQVRNAVYSFVTNFQTAFNPQLVSLYANGSREQMISLIFRSTKFSYYLLFIISAPVIFNCSAILSKWLTEVPPYTAIFTQLIIISSFFEALSAPLWTAIGATGNVKKYQILVSIILLADLPISYVCLKFGMNPSSVFLVNLIIGFLAYLYRLIYAQIYIKYSLSQYFKEVICPLLSVTFFVIIFLAIIIYIYPLSLNLFVNLAISLIITSVSIWFVGLKREERAFATSFFRTKIGI